jgi:hypothetical protein
MSDTEPTVERLLARIESLEKAVKSQRWTGLIAVLGMITVVFLVKDQLQPQSRTSFVADSVRTGSVITGSIALQNATGEIVGLFAAGTDGMPQLSLFDANKVRLSIGLRADGGPSISLSDPDNVARAVWSLNEQQDPSLVLFDSSKLPRALFILDRSSSGRLNLTGVQGGILLSAFDGKMTWDPKDGAAQEIQPAK